MTPCALALAVFLAGCAPTATVDSSSSQTVSDSADAVNAEDLVPETMIAQVQVLSDEVRTLRDQVEVLELELDDTRQRQKDLYDDLDARLRKFERGAPSSGETGAAPSSAEAEPAVEAEEAPSEAETSEEVAEPEPEPVIDPEVVREVYDNAFRTLRQGKYEDAIIEFNALVENYPTSELVDDALYWIAEANYVTKNLDIALMGFEQIIRDYPDNRRAAEAMLKIGYIYYDQQDYEQAQSYLMEVMERYPASRSAFSANRRLTKMRRDGNL